MTVKKDDRSPDAKAESQGIQYLGPNRVRIPVALAQALYDSCPEGPSRPAILSGLSRLGLDIRQDGFCLDETLYAHFINHGRPDSDLTLIFRAAVSRTDRGGDGQGRHLMSLQELVATGRFRFKGAGIMFSPDFQEELFQAYPAQSVEDGLRLAGIDPEAVGEARIERLEMRFQQRLHEKAAALPGEQGKEEEAGAVGRTATGKALKEGQMTDQELLATGLFVTSTAGLAIEPGFERRLYEAYPEQTIEEGFLKEGLTTSNIGMNRIYRFRSKFKALDGRDMELLVRDTSSQNCWEYSLTTVQKYGCHPYVEQATQKEIILKKGFYQEAAFLSSLPADGILEAFGLEPGLFTRKWRRQLEESLKEVPLVRMAEPSLEQMEDYEGLSLEILYGRMRGLDKALDMELAGLSQELAAMGHAQKKDVFQCLSALPDDPGRKFGTSYFIKALGISRTRFYSTMRDNAEGRDSPSREERYERDAEKVRRVFGYKGYAKGARQVYMLLPELEGTHISLDRVRKIMDKEGLRCLVRAPNPSRETGRLIQGRVKPDLLRRRFRLFRPGQVKLSDVTYLKLKGGVKAYGSAVLDPVTSKVVCFNASNRNDLDLVKETIRLAKEDPSFKGGIIHTDQGALYLSPEFQKEAEEIGFIQSMSKRGNCLDNAPQESFWGHFKDEVCLDDLTYQELPVTLQDYVSYYNGTRRLWDRERMTPLEYESYLLAMSDEEFKSYLARETEKYKAMKEKAAARAIERAKTLGVDGVDVGGGKDG